jgi:hypothetical protein
MRRMKQQDDRGVATIAVICVLTVMLGVAAVALDGGKIIMARRSAQNSADAAALAIATDCSRTGSPSSPAPYLKVSYGESAATPGCGGGTVTVTVNKTVHYSLAQVLGKTSDLVHRSATAKWGALGSSTGLFPLTIGTCAFTSAFNVKITLHSYAVPGCPNPSGQFGFISNGCNNQTVVAGQDLPGTTGNNLVGTGCNEASLQALLGKEILVPVWNSQAGTGSNATYHVLAYAIFLLTGWSTNGGSNHGGTLQAQCDGTADGDPVLPAGPDKNKPCIRGIFKGFTTQTGTIVPGLACKDNILACFVYLDH